MHFRDESTAGTPGLPCGFYWGIYLGDERSGAWKIDIWQTNRQAFDLVRRFGEEGYLGTGRLKQIAADLGNLSRN
jgi:hypothetical protein